MIEHIIRLEFDAAKEDPNLQTLVDEMNAEIVKTHTMASEDYIALNAADGLDYSILIAERIMRLTAKMMLRVVNEEVVPNLSREARLNRIISAFEFARARGPMIVTLSAIAASMARRGAMTTDKQ